MMLSSAGIALLIGAALSLRFRVFILFPAIGLALLGVAAVGIGRGERLGSVVLTMAFLGFALQIGYLAGIVTRAVWAAIRAPNADAPGNFAYLGRLRSFSMFKSIDVQDHMEVAGSDGMHKGMRGERRKNFRVEWNSPATIYDVERRLARPCVLINFSNTGAQITGVRSSTIADEFMLCITLGRTHKCRVIWRSDNALGV
jgi:hypothetical protein